MDTSVSKGSKPTTEVLTCRAIGLLYAPSRTALCLRGVEPQDVQSLPPRMKKSNTQSQLNNFELDACFFTKIITAFKITSNL
jgi:hypothetical protein